MRQKIHTDQAPQAIGTYSQAVKVDKTVYLSGQIPLNPRTMQLISADFTEQTKQIFINLQNVAKASGGGLENIVKLTVYLLDLANFPLVNEVMGQYFQEPYPARTTIEISRLPKDALIEVDAIMHLG